MEARTFAIVEKLRALGPGAIGGILLLVSAIIALIWANSPFAASYQALWETPFGFQVGGFELKKALVLWVNDGLMAIFFLLVGLEIKREVLDGALSSARKAALPVFAAIGGMAFPAIVFLVFNLGGEGINGWAIPAATDIAFVLGILALLGRRVPIELKVFLTAVAVVDDLGAVLVIALFYTGDLSTSALLAAAVTLAVLIVCNRMKVSHPLPYMLLGAALWLFVLKSGVHATVAGVLLALTIPARRMVSAEEFEAFGQKVFGVLDEEDEDELPPHTRVHAMRNLCNDAESLLLRWEHALQPWVLFAIMPIFALANAGVVIGDAGVGALTTPVSLGVMLGLAVGKPIGVTLMAWLAVKVGVAERPPACNWLQLHAAGWLAGIGFTMSLFITALAFPEGAMATQAKMGLLLGSLIAGIIGTVMLIVAARRNPPEQSAAA